MEGCSWWEALLARTLRLYEVFVSPPITEDRWLGFESKELLWALMFAEECALLPSKTLLLGPPAPGIWTAGERCGLLASSLVDMLLPLPSPDICSIDIY